MSKWQKADKRMLNIKNNMIMKYRVFAMMGMLALTAGSLLAQDYDDIYYDASKSVSGKTKEAKVDKKSKTVVVYNDVPEKYKVAAQGNYRVERDEDEYNRRGAYEPTSEPAYEVDINGDTIYIDSDTIYEDDIAFANTRRIERFYNPDIVILSDDDDLVELYYDESPTINLVVGTDVGYMAPYGWTASYYPWYTGWYDPWYAGWYDPWYRPYYSPWYAGWHDVWTYGLYVPWYYNYWHGPSLWGWTYWGPHYGHHHHHYWTPWYDNLNYWSGSSHGSNHRYNNNGTSHRSNGRVGYADNRNGNTRVDRTGTPRGGAAIGRNGNGTRTDNTGTRTRTRTRGWESSDNGGGSATTGGTTTTRSRSGNISTTPSRTSRSSSSGYYQGGSRSYGGSSSSSSGGRSRASSGSYGTSRTSGGGSYSSGSTYSSGGSRSYGGGGGSYSGGGSSRGSSGGGSSSSGGGGGRRH